MGGMATFDIVIRHPDFFAAAVPVCGSVNPERITSDIKTPFRIYHGDADPVVPLLGSRKAYRALKAAGVKADLIEFPGVGHGSWNPAVTDPEFLPWMFSQKK
jgi:predicted peptidase